MERLSLLFDLDGTLTNNKEGIVHSFQYALDHLGVRLDPAENPNRWIGPPLQETFARLLGPGQEHRTAEAVGFYREHYGQKGMLENRVYEGIEEALGDLGRTSDLYVATSKLRVFAVKILEHFAMNRYFKGIYGAEKDGTHTDKGELIAFLLAEGKIDPAHALMIGDREHDMLGAKKNRVPGVGAGWGFGSKEELLGSGALFVLNAPGDLPRYIQDYQAKRFPSTSGPGR